MISVSGASETESSPSILASFSHGSEDCLLNTLSTSGEGNCRQIMRGVRDHQSADQSAELLACNLISGQVRINESGVKVLAVKSL